ncbi:MAG: D-amino-acid transaminase [Caulobacterales bacterium]
MSRVAYVNGLYVPFGEASVHVEDRGFQFADGVYEVWAVTGGRLGDADGHFERLERSLRELSIDAPMSRAALQVVLKETVRRNRVRDGLVYLQVTRGRPSLRQRPRDLTFPDPWAPPSVVVTARTTNRAAAAARAEQGIGVVTTPETRWARCDIKTVGLLPNLLAKQQAKSAGAVEAWFVDDMGLVTEGASSNAWIVDRDGVLRTRDTQANILRGITRKTLISVMARDGVKVEERPFSVEEARQAREAFITGAGTLVMPVVKIDGAKVGDGTVGPVAKRLRQLYIEEARRTAL